MPGRRRARRQSVSSLSSAASSSRISACSGSVSWNSSTKIRLKRAWNPPPDLRVVAHQVARAEEQIEEVERAGPRLQLVVAIDGAAQVALQQRREIGVGVQPELIETRLERRHAPAARGRARRHSRTTRRGPSSRWRTSDPSRDRRAPLPTRRSPPWLVFPGRSLERDLVAEPADRARCPREQRVVRRGRRDA